MAKQTLGTWLRALGRRRPSEGPGGQRPQRPRDGGDPAEKKKRHKRRRHLFRKYFLLLAAMATGSLLLVVLPLTWADPAWGKAALLSLPPMLLAVLSEMVGAWWAADRSRGAFLAATMGGAPLRLALVLGWAWWVVSQPDVPAKVFLLALLFHWLLFTVPEIAMLIEFNRHEAEMSSEKTDG